MDDAQRALRQETGTGGLRGGRGGPTGAAAAAEHARAPRQPTRPRPVRGRPGRRPAPAGARVSPGPPGAGQAQRLHRLPAAARHVRVRPRVGRGEPVQRGGRPLLGRPPVLRKPPREHHLPAAPRLPPRAEPRPGGEAQLRRVRFAVPRAAQESRQSHRAASSGRSRSAAAMRRAVRRAGPAHAWSLSARAISASYAAASNRSGPTGSRRSGRAHPSQTTSPPSRRMVTSRAPQQPTLQYASASRTRRGRSPARSSPVSRSCSGWRPGPWPNTSGSRGRPPTRIRVSTGPPSAGSGTTASTRSGGGTAAGRTAAAGPAGSSPAAARRRRPPRPRRRPPRPRRRAPPPGCRAAPHAARAASRAGHSARWTGRGPATAAARTCRPTAAAGTRAPRKRRTRARRPARTRGSRRGGRAGPSPGRAAARPLQQVRIDGTGPQQLVKPQRLGEPAGAARVHRPAGQRRGPQRVKGGRPVPCGERAHQGAQLGVGGVAAQPQEGGGRAVQGVEGGNGRDVEPVEQPQGGQVRHVRRPTEPPQQGDARGHGGPVGAVAYEAAGQRPCRGLRPRGHGQRGGEPVHEVRPHGKCTEQAVGGPRGPGRVRVGQQGSEGTGDRRARLLRGEPAAPRPAGRAVAGVRGGGRPPAGTGPPRGPRRAGAPARGRTGKGRAQGRRRRGRG